MLYNILTTTFKIIYHSTLRRFDENKMEALRHFNNFKLYILRHQEASFWIELWILWPMIRYSSLPWN